MIFDGLNLDQMKMESIFLRTFPFPIRADIIVYIFLRSLFIGGGCSGGG